MAGSKSVELMAPTGAAIRATYDAALGMEALVSTVLRRPSGGVFITYEGETNSDSIWDNPETVLFRGERVFVDQDGALWRESQLIPVDREPDWVDSAFEVRLPDYNELLALVHTIHDMTRNQTATKEDIALMITAKVSV